MSDRYPCGHLETDLVRCEICKLRSENESLRKQLAIEHDAALVEAREADRLRKELADARRDIAFVTVENLTKERDEARAVIEGAEKALESVREDMDSDCEGGSCHHPDINGVLTAIRNFREKKS